jgi:hypothetical protein
MVNILHKMASFMKTNTSGIKIQQKYNKHILGIDHIAFRSLYKGMNKIDKNIYEKKSEIFNFQEYNVKANEYYKINNSVSTEYPLRIFSSYYIDDQCDNISQMISSLKNKNFGDLYSYNDYLYVYNWNQYVAWTMIHKDTINHIAYQVDNIEVVTDKLIKDGLYFSPSKKGYSIIENTVDNVLNISPDGKLIQSSLISNKTLYKFTDGYRPVPSTFIEFIERKDGREGFSESNANNIIHSTKNL